MANEDNGNVELSNFDFVKHNPTDYEAFGEFSKNVQERYARTEKARILEVRKKNLLTWLDSVPSRWRDAALKDIDDKLKDQIIELLKEKHKGYFIAGPHGSGKTHIAFAIVRKLVAAGVAKPSEIKFITESDLLKLATGGFETRHELDDLVHTNYKVYIYDSVGSKERFEHNRELPAIASFIESIYNNEGYFICTSYQSINDYEDQITDSTASKLRAIVRTKGLIYTGAPIAPNDEQPGPSDNKDPYGWND